MSIVNWFFEGVSHYLTIILAKFLVNKKSANIIFVSGPPRSGTSWISDVLAFYFNMPRPKHYKLPLFFDSIIHTHSILNKQYIDNVIYIKRNGLEAYISQYRALVRDLLSDKNFIYRNKYLKIFKDINNPSNIDYNVRCLINMDLNKRKGIIYSIAKIKSLETKHKANVIDYDIAKLNPLKEFRKSIYRIDSNVDENRLVMVLRLLEKSAQNKLPLKRKSTFINEKESSSDMISKSLIDFYNDKENKILSKL